MSDLLVIAQNYQQFIKRGTTPGAAPTGMVRLWIDSDGNVQATDENGDTVPVGGGGGGVESFNERTGAVSGAFADVPRVGDFYTFTPLTGPGPFRIHLPLKPDGTPYGGLSVVNNTGELVTIQDFEVVEGEDWVYPPENQPFLFQVLGADDVIFDGEGFPASLAGRRSVGFSAETLYVGGGVFRQRTAEGLSSESLGTNGLYGRQFLYDKQRPAEYPVRCFAPIVVEGVVLDASGQYVWATPDGTPASTWTVSHPSIVGASGGTGFSIQAGATDFTFTAGNGGTSDGLDITFLAWRRLPTATVTGLNGGETSIEVYVAEEFTIHGSELDQVWGFYLGLQPLDIVAATRTNSVVTVSCPSTTGGATTLAFIDGTALLTRVEGITVDVTAAP